MTKKKILLRRRNSKKKFLPPCAPVVPLGVSANQLCFFVCGLSVGSRLTGQNAIVAISKN